MELAINELQKCLMNMITREGYTHQQITTESKVHNIGRISNGQTKPTAKTWWKLHKMYPEYIPTPTWTDGTQIIKPAKCNGSVTQLNSAIQLTPPQQVIVDLLNKHDADDEIAIEVLRLTMEIIVAKKSK